MGKRFGQPNVWWDTEPAAGPWPTKPERGGDPWYELGDDLEAVLMKAAISLTKGRTWHVFLISAFKATITA